MKATSNLVKILAVTSLVWVGAAVSARATLYPQVSLALQNYTTEAVMQSPGTYAGSPIDSGDVGGAYDVGVYSFLTSSSGITGLGNGVTIYSICLSPAGTLDTGTYVYNYEPFSDANPGINPNNLWAYSGTSYWGVQNASYLWKLLGLNAVGGPGNLPGVQGAALAQAVYTALYDSTGYGTYQVTSGNFSPTFTGYPGGGTIANEQADYNADLAQLTAAAVEANLATGYVLVPQSSAKGGPSGQEFILLDPLDGKVNPPVPEPTTIISGALLLLPFGASTLRILRKKNSV